MFIAGLIVFMIAVIAILKAVSNRLTRPAGEWAKEVSNLKKGSMNRKIEWMVNGYVPLMVIMTV